MRGTPPAPSSSPDWVPPHGPRAWLWRRRPGSEKPPVAAAIPMVSASIALRLGLCCTSPQSELHLTRGVLARCGRCTPARPTPTRTPTRLTEVQRTPDCRGQVHTREQPPRRTKYCQLTDPTPWQLGSQNLKPELVASPDGSPAARGASNSCGVPYSLHPRRRRSWKLRRLKWWCSVCSTTTIKSITLSRPLLPTERPERALSSTACHEGAFVARP